nr:protein argonaute-2-like [Cherax quadricarinatus]
MVQIPQKRRRLEETMVMDDKPEGATLEGEGEDTAPPGEEGSHQEGATLEGEGEDTAPPGEEGSHQEVSISASESTLCLTMVQIPQKRRRLEETMVMDDKPEGATLEGEGEDTAPPGEEGSHQEGATLEGEGEDTAPPGEEGSHQEGATLEGEGEDTAPPGEEGSHQEVRLYQSFLSVYYIYE